MKSDIEIAQECVMEPITKVAENFGIDVNDLEMYGKYKAKISDELFKSSKNNKDAKLVLVTAVNPTPAGEGKTTVTIGLSQALNQLGKKTLVALREPSLGPCMGVKGGAAGGGYSQVVPMEDINLHFTGDIHAMTTANNLLSSIIDNHIKQGNVLGIDPDNIIWKRCVDLNDRVLRDVIVGVGGKLNGVTREDGFMITVASEIMAVVCLAEDITDLKDKLGKMVVAYTYDGKPVTPKDLHIVGAMAALLKDALKPNLVQTLEHTPAFIHGGPFANIAHGCNSVKATKTAMKLSDITITEAGFGADLGAEKFFDIKCRKAGLKPDAVVLVATVRALKYNGGVPKTDLNTPNLEAVKKGFCNLEKHIENLHKFGVPVVVTLNNFITDTPEEVEYIKTKCEEMGADFAIAEVWAKGGEGGKALAEKVLDVLENKESNFHVLYDENDTIVNKITTIAKEIYGAADISIDKKAMKEIKKIEDLGMDKLPICIAKTQFSLSDDATKLGRPEGFTLNVKEIRLSAGAGFIVALTGNVMVMPGLPKVPAAENIDVDENGKITFVKDYPFAKYVAKEIEKPAGYVTNEEVVTFDTKYQGQGVKTAVYSSEYKNTPTTFEFTKTDITSGAELTGATLTVLDKDGNVVDTWTSDAKEAHVIKKLVFGETYTLREEFAPYGYLKATDIQFTVEDTGDVQHVEMNDEVPTGSIVINKDGEFVTDTTLMKGHWYDFIFNYFKDSLAGVTFDVYAKEDIVSADGLGTVYHKAGDKVATIVTNDKGIARIDNLPLGRYYLVETKTLDGFVLDDTPIDADLSYIDQNTKVVFAGMDVTNERQKVQISVTKTDSETKKKLEGAVFGLFAKEDIVNKDGKVIVKADTRIERGVTGKDGKVTFTSDLPLGQYYVKELEAPKGYVKSDKIFDVDASYQGDKVKVIEFEAAFENAPIKVEISKTDITGEKEFGLSTLFQTNFFRLFFRYCTGV